MQWPPANAIVVPVDFSDRSKDALDTALQIAGDPARVRVIHVVPPLAPVEPVMAETPNDELRSRHAREHLDQWLDDPRYRGVEREVVLGDPGHEIAHFAEQLGAGLIVMPSHGRTGLARLLLGSVAERTLRLAHCPVLVLRRPE